MGLAVVASTKVMFLKLSQYKMAVELNGWRRGEVQGQGTKECHQGRRQPEESGASRATGREYLERKGCLAERASQVRSENYPWRIDLRNMEAVSVLTRGVVVLGQEKVGRGAQDIRSW